MLIDRIKDRANELKMGFDDLIEQIAKLFTENQVLKSENERLKAELEELKAELEPPLTEWCCLEGVSGFSNNFAYEGYGSYKPKTNAYKGWQCNFPFNKLWKKEVWEALGVDFSQPIELLIRLVQPENLDTTNCIKAIQDQIVGDTRGLCVNDNLVVSCRISRIDICSKYSEGKIYYYIRNYKLIE